MSGYVRGNRSDIGDRREGRHAQERIRHRGVARRGPSLNLGPATDARMRTAAGFVLVVRRIVPGSDGRGAFHLAMRRRCTSHQRPMATTTARRRPAFGHALPALLGGSVTAKRRAQPATRRAAEQATDRQQVEKPAKHRALDQRIPNGPGVAREIPDLPTPPGSILAPANWADKPIRPGIERRNAEPGLRNRGFRPVCWSCGHRIRNHHVAKLVKARR